MISQKAKNIRLLLLDVDGILTNGRLCYLNDASEVKVFHIHDGLGIKLLQRMNIPVGIISGKTSPALLKRIAELGIKFHHLNCEDKLPAYENIKASLSLKDEEIAFMGDDLPDLPLLKRVGLAITVPDAYALVKNEVDYITEKKGGEGAVREVCDLILQAQNHYQSILNDYLR